MWAAIFSSPVGSRQPTQSLDMLQRVTFPFVGERASVSEPYPSSFFLSWQGNQKVLPTSPLQYLFFNVLIPQTLNIVFFWQRPPSNRNCFLGFNSRNT